MEKVLSGKTIVPTSHITSQGTKKVDMHTLLEQATKRKTKQQIRKKAHKTNKPTTNTQNENNSHAPQENMQQINNNTQQTNTETQQEQTQHTNNNTPNTHTQTQHDGLTRQNTTPFLPTKYVLRFVNPNSRDLGKTPVKQAGPGGAVPSTPNASPSDDSNKINFYANDITPEKTLPHDRSVHANKKVRMDENVSPKF